MQSILLVRFVNAARTKPTNTMLEQSVRTRSAARWQMLSGALLLLFTISHENHSDAADRPSPPWSVFFLSLQKGGTSSFAHFMGELGWPSVHACYIKTCLTGPLFGASWGSRRESQHNDSAAAQLPDYAAFVNEMDARRKEEFASFLRERNDGRPFAAADESWPLLFRFLDKSTRGRAKFVIWRRNCSLWASSFVRWFRGYGAYGFSRFCLLSYGGDGCMACLDHAPLVRACEAHYEAVLSYFARADRRERLLDLDFTHPNAGRALCAFALGVNEQSSPCGSIGKLPSVPPEALTEAWQEEFGHKHVVSELTRRLEAMPASWRVAR